MRVHSQRCRWQTEETFKSCGNTRPVHSSSFTLPYEFHIVSFFFLLGSTFLLDQKTKRILIIVYSLCVAHERRTSSSSSCVVRLWRGRRRARARVRRRRPSGSAFLGGTKGDDQRMHCRKAYRIQKREEDAEEKAARHARCRRQRKTERS